MIWTINLITVIFSKKSTKDCWLSHDTLERWSDESSSVSTVEFVLACKRCPRVRPSSQYKCQAWQDVDSLTKIPAPYRPQTRQIPRLIPPRWQNLTPRCVRPSIRDRKFSRNGETSLVSSTCKEAVGKVAEVFRSNRWRDPRHDQSNNIVNSLSLLYRGFHSTDPPTK